MLLVRLERHYDHYAKSKCRRGLSKGQILHYQGPSREYLMEINFYRISWAKPKERLISAGIMQLIGI